MIHESAQLYIAQIARKSRRALRVTLDRKNSRMPIQIVATYAPRSGNKEEDRGQHWRGAKEILNETRKRHMIIWRADSNGELCKEESAEQNTNRENAATQIAGPYARATKTEKGAEESTDNRPGTSYAPDDDVETTDDIQS